MKQKLQLFLCSLLLSFGVFSQNIPSYVPTNGLVGWWPFNGNANDESGNGNHGTVNGATLTSDRNGVAGKAYSFDGVNDYIEGLYSNFPLGNSARSISAWIFPQNNSNYFNFIASWGLGTSNQSSANQAFGFLVSHPSLIGIWQAFGNSQQNEMYNYPNFPQNIFIHAVVSINETGNFTFYVNSQPIYSSTIIGMNTIANSNIYRIGRSSHTNTDGWAGYFLGKIDDVSIYNRALNQQEITALYTGVNPCSLISQNVISKDSIFSNNDSAKIEASGQLFPYLWSSDSKRNLTSGTNIIYVDSSGYYKLNTWLNGCQISDSVFVSIIKADLISKDTIIQSGNSVKLRAVNNSSPYFLVDKNGNKYPSVNIGTQTWTQINLNVSTYNNGDPIPEVKSSNEWSNINTGAWSWYNNDSASFANKYGKLYNWFALKDTRGFVPNGWHLPSNLECDILVKSIEPTIDTSILGGWAGLYAGGQLKESGISNWSTPNTGANNKTGLTIRPSGFRHPNGTFNYITQDGYWWTNTEYDETHSWYRALEYGNSSIHKYYESKSFGFPVRLIRDNFKWSTGETNSEIIVKPTKTTTYYCEFTNGITSFKDSVTIYVKNQIVSTSNANGSISPSGTNSVNSGSNQTYTFTPNPGYWVDSVIVNGVQVPTASSYTFSNVTSNQSIRVTYRSLAAALAAANICSNDTLVSTVNLPAQSNVRATSYYSNIFLFNQNNTSNAYKYNVNDRKYTTIANKPSPCIECGVAEANGKIYCFNTNGTTQAYDIATNTWQTKANQTSTSSSSVYAASINNKIYILGTNNNQNTFTQYNPQTNSYTALANPTINANQSRLVAFNNKLYKIGGTDNNSQPTSSVEVYNPSNNTWTSMPDLPVALTQVGATHYDNKLYVYGGKQANNTNSNKVYVFDFTSNAWYAESNTQNTNRTHIEAKTANNMVFLFGGADTTNTQTNQAQRYFCKDQLCTCKWAEYVCNGVSSDVPCPTSSLYRPGTVFCNGYATKVVDVTNPITGKTWMDRNLGAQRAATSSTDSLAYGDLYQWGRGADGHQCRNSATTTTLSTTDQPGHGNFIISTNSPFDWRSTQNNNLWQGVNGVNNPCPTDYRIPTYNELETEKTSWLQNNNTGAFNSDLKLPLPGLRSTDYGYIYNISYGGYWSSSVNGITTYYLFFNSGIASIASNLRAYGFSVRCIKD